LDSIVFFKTIALINFVPAAV